MSLDEGSHSSQAAPDPKLDPAHGDGAPSPRRPVLSEPPHPTSNRDRSERIEKEIAEMFFRLLEEAKAAAGERFPPKKTSLRLILEVVPPGCAGAPEGQLYAQVAKAVERCIEDNAAFPLGRVYCHWCRSYKCEHSYPPDPRCVFAGYTVTGQPVWQELVSVLLARRHPGVDGIFREDPQPVAVVQEGRELSSEQLSVYGKRSSVFRIIGQVALGYLPFPGAFALPPGSHAQRSPLAITFQAVETGNGGRPPVLNIVGKLPNGTPAFQALEEYPDGRIADALRSVRRSLEEVGLLPGGAHRRKRQGERARRVVAILWRLARNLERIFRQRHRRTQHAQDRHQNRARPASTALRDALHARPEEVFRDVEERTWIVLGPKNRVHVFNDEARHVTSVTYPGETVRQRTTRGKWIRPRPEELAPFLETLHGRADGERAG